MKKKEDLKKVRTIKIKRSKIRKKILLFSN